MTLTEFIKARLDEDEATARAAEPNMVGQEWRSVSYYGDGGQVERAAYPHDVVVYDEGSPSAEQAGHIARHDPSRVLNQVNSLRGILDLCEHALLGGRQDETAALTLRWLGDIWCTHDDHRSEWSA